MKYLILLLSATTICYNAIGQTIIGESVTPIAHVRLGLPGSMVLIPLSTEQTAYYICESTVETDIHIISNDSLDILISNWEKGVYEPKDPVILPGHNIYIKPHSRADDKVVRMVSNSVLSNGVKKYSVANIDPEEETLVNEILQSKADR